MGTLIHSSPFDRFSLMVRSSLASIFWGSVEYLVSEKKMFAYSHLLADQDGIAFTNSSSVAVICALSFVKSLAGSLILWLLRADTKHPATVVIQIFIVIPCFLIGLIRSSFVPNSSKFAMVTLVTMVIVHGKSCQDENLERS